MTHHPTSTCISASASWFIHHFTSTSIPAIASWLTANIWPPNLRNSTTTHGGNGGEILSPHPQGVHARLSWCYSYPKGTFSGHHMGQTKTHAHLSDTCWISRRPMTNTHNLIDHHKDWKQGTSYLLKDTRKDSFQVVQPDIKSKTTQPYVPRCRLWNNYKTILNGIDKYIMAKMIQMLQT